MTSKELYQKAKGILEEVKAMRASAGETPTPDQLKAIDAKLGQYDQAKLQADQSARIEGGEEYLSQPETVAASLGWREAGALEGTLADSAGVTIDRKTGALVAADRGGEARIGVLQSAQYKDALNRYLRALSLKRSISPADAKVLQAGQDTAGGYWIAPEMHAEVVRKQATMASIRRYARAFPVGTDYVSFPKVAYTTDDKYSSGIRFSWTAEAPSADISEATNPVAGRANIPVHTATAAIILTRQMMEDPMFDVLGLVSELIAEGFALGENDAFINGDGVGKPQGILAHSNATVAHASGGMYVAGGAASAIAWGTDGVKGVIGLEAALPPQYEPNARWYGAKGTFAALRALNSGAAGIQWSLGDQYPNAANGYQAALLGYPITKDQFFPAIAANAYPLVFGDMQGYWIADRVGITIDVLREARALRDEVVLYARKRVGAQLVHDWRLKVLKIATS